MAMDDATIVAIVSAFVATLALIWAIYSHFSNRKIARLTYEISQLADYDVPDSFLNDIPLAPVAITITSRGNKSTENIVLVLEAKSPIAEIESSWPVANFEHNKNYIKFNENKLNPSQEIKLFLKCEGKAFEDQILEFELSHSEGMGINEREKTNITFEFMGFGIEYNPNDLKAHLTRIGPLIFR